MPAPKKQTNYDQLVNDLVQAGTLDGYSSTLGNDLHSWLKGQSRSGQSTMNLGRCRSLAKRYQYGMWSIARSITKLWRCSNTGHAVDRMNCEYPAQSHR